MILPSDKEYKQTKLIKQGKKNMPQEFQDLAKWIDKTFEVSTLNIIRYKINDESDGLKICLEFEKDENKFYTKEGYLEIDKQKQRNISSKYGELFQRKKKPRKKSVWNFLKRADFFDENIWVVFSSFERIAKMEIGESISDQELKEFQESLKDKNLWTISNAFSTATFFLFTDEQVKLYTENGIKEKWGYQYFDLIKPFDEFDYLKLEEFTIYLDSKENFDNNYESNWFYYYK